MNVRFGRESALPAFSIVVVAVDVDFQRIRCRLFVRGWFCLFFSVYEGIMFLLLNHIVHLFRDRKNRRVFFFFI